MLVTQLGDRHLLQQMPPQNGDLLFRRVVLPFFFMRSLRYLNGRTLSPFPAEARQDNNREKGPQHYIKGTLCTFTPSAKTLPQIPKAVLCY